MPHAADLCTNAALDDFVLRRLRLQLSRGRVLDLRKWPCSGSPLIFSEQAIGLDELPKPYPEKDTDGSEPLFDGFEL